MTVEFVKTKEAVCQLACRKARHCAQLFLFWPPGGEEAPVNRAGESWELAFFGVDGVDPHTDSLSEALSLLLPPVRAFSSSSFKGNIRRSHGDWGCQRTQEGVI